MGGEDGRATRNRGTEKVLSRYLEAIGQVDRLRRVSSPYSTAGLLRVGSGGGECRTAWGGGQGWETGGRETAEIFDDDYLWSCLGRGWAGRRGGRGGRSGREGPPPAVETRSAPSAPPEQGPNKLCQKKIKHNNKNNKN